MVKLKTRFTEQVGIEYPIICGAMYPCSNPELVAAVSEAGGIGIVQPLSLTYVHGYELKKGLEYIRSLTSKPYGMNIIVEQSSQTYENRMRHVVDVALQEGCRFFVTALGNPQWVVEKVKEKGGIVYHDATERRWAEKALKYGVDGLICVNNRAGGHAGSKTPQDLYEELKDLGVPLICAGGIGEKNDFVRALELGYDGVQMGTRFIATRECSEKANYKQAIVDADAKDIVLTERVTGIPLSVIKTPYVEKMGTKVGPLSKYLLKNRWTKKYMRLWYGWKAIRDFKKVTQHGHSTKDYWQAGKSVSGVHSIESASDVIMDMVKLPNVHE
ncbi:MAG: nitronate monooxygenase [Chlamydiota bacterium]|nr:nitronate monooxygenase [Chlamydiota bacterium]